MSVDTKIKLFLQDKDVFLWNAKDSVKIRDEWRIVGSLIGCLPRFPRQNNQLGLPLILMPEETTLLLEKGVCVLVKAMETSQVQSSQQVKEHERLRSELYEQQIELFKEERKREISQNLHQIREGKKKKLKQELEKKKEAGESVEETDIDVDVDVDSIEIPPVPLKNTLVQLYTESPYQEEYTECSSDWTYPSNDQEGTRYKVFKDLWGKGYFLTSGSKFGGDYMVYPGVICSNFNTGTFNAILEACTEKDFFKDTSRLLQTQKQSIEGDPARYHSFYIAVCLPHKDNIPMLDFISLARIGSNVRKTFVLCSVDGNDKVVYTSLQWTGIS